MGADVEGFEWLLEMRDGVSGPAHAMRASVAQLGQEARNAEGGMRKLHESQTKGVASGVAMGEVWAKGLEKVAEWAQRAFEGVTELVAEGLKLSLEMGELREHSKRMFEGLSGSKAGGEEMYATIQKLRGVLPQSEKELSSWAATLMGAGMTDARSVAESVKAMSAASALMGGGEMGAAASQKVGSLTAKSLESGQFKGSAKSLVGTGVSADDLAKELGMTPANFQAAFKKGAIEASKGIDALNHVLQKKGTSAVASTMSEVPTMIAKGREAFAHMFDDVNAKPLIHEIGLFVNALTGAGPASESSKKTITSTFNAIALVAADVTHGITLGFLYTELAILKAEHAMDPLIKSFKRWVDEGEALTAVKGILVGMAVAAGLLAVGVAAVLVPLYAIYRAIKLPFDVLSAMVDKALDLKAALTGVPRVQVTAPGGGGSSWDDTGGTSPAHATGGLVGKPAPGEAWASVAPGETIMPKGSLGKLGEAGERSGAPTSGGDRSVSVDIGGIRIDGAGKTAPQVLSLLVSELADALESVAREAGAA
jgi:hypothetical protein